MTRGKKTDTRLSYGFTRPRLSPPLSCAFKEKNHTDVSPAAAAALRREYFLHSEKCLALKVKNISAFSSGMLHIKWVVSCFIATAVAMTRASPEQLLQCLINKRRLWIQEPKLFLAPCYSLFGEHRVTIGHCLKESVSRQI